VRFWLDERLTAKEITPIAWNTPGRMKEKMCEDDPRKELSTATPRRTTAATITIIETRAELVSTLELGFNSSRLTERGRFGQFDNVPVQTERKGDGDGDEDDDGIPIDEQLQASMLTQGREDVGDDMRYGVACIQSVDASSNHPG
jgi:hypothetical protein